VPELRDTKLVWRRRLDHAGVPRPAGTLAACRARCATALDNTWGAGSRSTASSRRRTRTGLGADIVMQALTKYPSGGADVLMGSVCTRTALHDRLNYAHEHLGYGWARTTWSWCCAPAHDAAALRGAGRVPAAGQLDGRPAEVARVFHPALRVARP
jgi:cystathionine beta-lyase